MVVFVPWNRQKRWDGRSTTLHAMFPSKLSTLHSTMRVRIGWAGRSYMIAAGHAWGTKVLVSSLCRMIACHRRIWLVFVSSFSSFGFTPPPFTALNKEFLASNNCYMASFLLFYWSLSMLSKLDSPCRHPKNNASMHQMWRWKPQASTLDECQPRQIDRYTEGGQLPVRRRVEHGVPTTFSTDDCLTRRICQSWSFPFPNDNCNSSLTLFRDQFMVKYLVFQLRAADAPSKSWDILACTLV